MDNTKVYLLGIKKRYGDYSVVTILWDNVYLGRITEIGQCVEIELKGRRKSFITENMKLAIKFVVDDLKSILANPADVYYKEIEVDMLDKDTFEEVK